MNTKQNLLTVAALLLGLLAGCASLQSKSTTELKLRHAQLAESLGDERGQVDLEWLKPIFARGPSRAEKVAEKQRIESALLQRYEAGDKDAYLPIFKSAAAPEPR